MDLRKWHDVFEWPVMILLIAGLATATFKLTIAGFTPVIWLLLSIWSLLIIICMEVTMIRENLDKKQ